MQVGTGETGITDRQRQYITFITDFIDVWGYSPTFDEIAKGMKVSKSSVQSALSLMRKSGALTYKDGSPRTIVIKET